MSSSTSQDTTNLIPLSMIAPESDSDDVEMIEIDSNNEDEALAAEALAAINATNVEQFYNAASEDDKLRVLLTMAVELEKDYRNDQRLLAHLGLGLGLIMASICFRAFLIFLSCWHHILRLPCNFKVQTWTCALKIEEVSK